MNAERFYGPLVVVESPRRGRAPRWAPRPLAAVLERVDHALNRHYAKQCVRDSLLRGEHPYASHVLFEHGALDSRRDSELRAGMRAGIAWGAHGDVRAYYVDRGISAEMRDAIDVGALGAQIEFRTLWPRRNWFPTEHELRALSRP